MSIYYILQDQRKCIGCLSCEVHCKSNKGLPLGPRLGQIIPVGPKMVADLPKQAFVFMPCFHCEEPWCVPACPTGAIFGQGSTVAEMKRDRSMLTFLINAREKKQWNI